MYHKLQSYDVWFLCYGVWQAKVFVILDHFLHLYPLTTQKIKILKKLKKAPWDIIILQKCTNNHDHMLYCSWVWHMTDVIVIFHFGLFFAFLPPQQHKKSRFYRNEKNTWRYHHFTYVYQKLWSDDVWFLRYCAWWMDEQQTDRQKKWHIEVGAPHDKLP